MNNNQLDVVEAYLCKGWSHRKIQKDILKIDAPVRGGGYEAMSILHSFGIRSEHKGIFKGQELDRDLFSEKRSIRGYLETLNDNAHRITSYDSVNSQTNTSEADALIKDNPTTNEDNFERLLIELNCEYERIHQDNVSFFRLAINSDTEAGTVIVVVVLLGNEAIITSRGFIEDVRQDDYLILKHINRININQPFVCFSYDEKKVSSNMFLPFTDTFCPGVTMNGVLKMVAAISNEYRGLMKVIWS